MIIFVSMENIFFMLSKVNIRLRNLVLKVSGCMYDKMAGNTSAGKSPVGKSPVGKSPVGKSPHNKNGGQISGG